MKTVTILFLSVFTTFAFAQKTTTDKLQYYSITQDACIKKKGYRMLLKEIVSDSRCPEGVTCVWAGEIQVVVSLYKDRKFVEIQTLTVSSKHFQENMKWFAKYLPSAKRNIKSVAVLPYPKEGTPVNPKDYYIKIGYIK